VGVKGRLKAFAEYRHQTTLAVSLHAPNHDLRLELIPSAQHYPLEDLLKECLTYVEMTHRRLTFEYVLLHGVNDGENHARELAQRVKGFQSHVNLIPYNPIGEGDYQRPPTRSVQRFLQILEASRIPASVRQTRGVEQSAACGQLRRQTNPLL